MKRTFIISFLISFAASNFSCEPQLIDDPIPLVTFADQVINLSLPEFSALRVDRGFKTFDKIGVRGVIVYRINATTFRAYDRNCSYHPNEAAATVNIHSSNLYMQDFSCNSTFSFEEGLPTAGPAWRPLRQYRTDVTGGVLTVTSEVIN